jgi:hypothetical protein
VEVTLGANIETLIYSFEKYAAIEKICVESKFAMQNMQLPFGLINKPPKFRTDHSVCNLHQQLQIWSW